LKKLGSGNENLDLDEFKTFISAFKSKQWINVVTSESKYVSLDVSIEKEFDTCNFNLKNAWTP
jgi:hypothetical protein